MTTFAFLGSLALGLTAWILAIAAIRRKRCGGLTVLSFTACCASLLLQLMEADYLANTIGDISALMDTIGAVVLAGWVMLAGAVLLNALALRQERRRSHDAGA